MTWLYKFWDTIQYNIQKSIDVCFEGNHTSHNLLKKPGWNWIGHGQQLLKWWWLHYNSEIKPPASSGAETAVHARQLFADGFSDGSNADWHLGRQEFLLCCLLHKSVLNAANNHHLIDLKIIQTHLHAHCTPTIGIKFCMDGNTT